MVHWFSHLHTSHIAIVSFPPPTVACKTTGKERLGKRLRRYQMYAGVCGVISLSMS